MAGAGGWRGGGCLRVIALHTTNGRWEKGDIASPKPPRSPWAGRGGMLGLCPPRAAPHPLEDGSPKVPSGTFTSPECFCCRFAGSGDFHC